jgi:2'-5' RNA ligase
MQSLELLFDAATETALRGEWASLLEAGLPSSARNTSRSNRPHVTVVVARAGLDRTLDAVRSGVAELLPLPVPVGGYLVFPSPRGAVLSRSIVVSGALLDLHARVNRAVAADAAVLETARPDAWTPHATIARRLSPEQLGAAIELLPRAGRAATATGLRLWDSETRTVTLVAGRDEAGQDPAGEEQSEAQP